MILQVASGAPGALTLLLGARAVDQGFDSTAICPHHAETRNSGSEGWKSVSALPTTWIVSRVARRA